MNTVEILAGAGFANAVHDLELTSAQCTYHYQPPTDSYREDYQVWSLSKEDFDILCAVKEEDWKVEGYPTADWGWWRHALGSNMGPVLSEYVINNEKIVAWDGAHREHYFEDFCQDCSDYIVGVCQGTEEDQLDCYRDREYEDLLRYFCDEIGASTEKNVCALAIDLAKQNNMTLSELFKKYLGGNRDGN